MTGIERLRKLSKDMLSLSLWVRLAIGTEKDWDCCQGDGRTVNDELLSIANQIERENIEDSEAAEWVREHGGLSDVRLCHNAADNRRAELCSALGINLETGWSDAMAVMRPRLMPKGCDWEFLKLHMSNLRGFMLDVMDRLGVDKSDSDAPEIAFDVLDRRLMPEGMEWMLWDDGKPVTYDDAPDDVIGVYLALDGSGYVLMTDLPDQLMSEPSERVKRPAVPASDGEPLEVGQTVWDVEDGTEWCVTKVKDGKVFIAFEDFAAEECDPSLLTHQRPVLDADGVPIHVGDTVFLLPGEWCDRFPCCGFYGGEEVEVFADGEARHVPGGVQCRDKKKTLGGYGTCYPQPSQLSHRAPVLAADGKPLREGETVWDKDAEADTPLTVVEVSSDLVRCEYTWKDGKTYRPCYPPDQLTHERPDTWQRIEEDARWMDSGADCGMFTYTHEDLVRRAKALAERERGE